MVVEIYLRDRVSSTRNAANPRHDPTRTASDRPTTDLRPPRAQRVEQATSETLVGGVHNVDTMSSRVVMVDPTKGLREFEFDAVLPER